MLVSLFAVVALLLIEQYTCLGPGPPECGQVARFCGDEAWRAEPRKGPECTRTYSGPLRGSARHLLPLIMRRARFCEARLVQEYLMQVRWSWLLAALMPMLGGNTEGRKAADGPPHRVVGYFAEWGIYQRKYLVTDIPAAKLTHVNYAFARIVDGKCAIVDAYAAVDRAYPGDKWDPGEKRGNFKQLTLLRKKHPHLKTLISVGGWTLSGPFSDTALTEQSRQKFAASCVAFMLEHGFDGVDVDWEYPGGGGLESNKTRPEDGRNFSSLLAELRRLLDQQGVKDKRKYLLTIAAPAGPGTYKHIEIDKIHRHLDWINLMTYDFHGSWSELTNFSAPLLSVIDRSDQG